MGLVADTSIVTDAEVAAITGEAELANLEDVTSGKTRALVRGQATNYLMLRIRKEHGVDPALISNTSELKDAAAWHVASIFLGAGDEQQRERAVIARTNRDEALKLYQFVSSEGGDEQFYSSPMPRSLHLDPYPRTSSAPPTSEPCTGPTYYKE